MKIRENTQKLGSAYLLMTPKWHLPRWKSYKYISPLLQETAQMVQEPLWLRNVFYDVFQNDKVKAVWELVWGDLIDIFS
jgi:hypothetical protein